MRALSLCLLLACAGEKSPDSQPEPDADTDTDSDTDTDTDADTDTDTDADTDSDTDSDTDTDTGVAPTGTLSLASAHARLEGESAEDEAGRSVDHAGDVNGDGWPDLVTGAQRNDRNGDGAGAGYLVLGPVDAGVSSLSEADAIFTGAEDDCFAGAAIAAGQDVDQDGFDDLFIDAQDTDGDGGDDVGVDYLIYGPVTGVHSLAEADAWLIGEAMNDNAGQSIAMLGDVNADGFPDLLVGAQAEGSAAFRAGAVYLALGPVEGALPLADADAKMLGEAEEDRAGGYCRGGTADGGDLNGDGVSDLLIASFGWWPHVDHAGRFYAVYGPPPAGVWSLADADAVVEGVGETEVLGVALVAADFNDDGYSDVAAGAPGNSDVATEAGAAYVLTGPLAASDTVASAVSTVRGERAYRHAGFALDSGVDSDQDGAVDLALGGAAFGRTDLADDGGHAYLFYDLPEGSSAVTEADWILSPEGFGQQSGTSVSLGGDLTGDGQPDLLVGCWNYGASVERNGALYVLAAGLLP